MLKVTNARAYLSLPHRQEDKWINAGITFLRSTSKGNFNKHLNNYFLHWGRLSRGGNKPRGLFRTLSNTKDGAFAKKIVERSILDVWYTGFEYASTKYLKFRYFSNLTIKSPEQRQWRRSNVFIVIFEHISHFSVSIVEFGRVT